MTGKSISHYQILEKLGEGGMGVVWKARDTRLNRTVALKTLPAAYHDHPDLRQRFLHEAQAASALSHPHIVTVFDVVEQDGAEFIVMEYIAGKTLDALIPRKGMRLSEALRIGVQVADALSAAHRAGIVHRDLKPSNVIVQENGAVKVLDFGLAKTEEKPAGGQDDATRTSAPKTLQGLAVGTVGYMSPEQAEAREVDARSDIFSFGTMLYEMVTGERAFRGETNLATMAAVLHKEPSPIPSDIPPELQRVITRCLRKDRRRRFQHMDDLMVALEELREESESGTLAAIPAAHKPNARPRWWIGIAACLALAAAGAWWLTRGTPANSGASEPTEIPITADPGSISSPGFSPDGNQVAYSWTGSDGDNPDIYVKLIGAPTPLRLTTDPAPDTSPAFSPDGRTIGFLRAALGGTQLITIPPIGGTERIVAQLPKSVTEFAWLPDGKSVIITGLEILSLDTGDHKPLVKGRLPALSPDSRNLAFVRGESTGGDAYLVRFEGDQVKGEPRRLTDRNQVISGLAWTPDGADLVIASGTVATPGNLWRVHAASPSPPRLLSFGRGGVSHLAVARTGSRLAYIRNMRVVNLSRLPLSGEASPSGPATTFLPSTRTDFHGQYSPDGKHVAFHSTRSGTSGLWLADADGSKVAELYIPAQGHAGSPAWSPDGQMLAFDCNETGAFQVYTIRAIGGKPVRFTDGPSSTVPGWSRDGRWIYFSRNGEVWKAHLGGGGNPIQVTHHGGFLADESVDGKYLFYTKSSNNTGLWRMPLEGGEEIQVLPSILLRMFALSSQGIYFAPAPADRNAKVELMYMPFGGKPKVVLPLPKPPTFGLSVSPDNRFLLYSQVEVDRHELMLVDGFR